ncbi:hypothetical protein FK004_02480 [Flavobacterium kingsejongi]|uniref:Uncharacterized protein n=2 Tax=Flavobacterium kingsejongi TaxID=1678728 RepID=A0A2S1LKW3_9FLAO|nr:hypothetical protein FK004_02480 [Flavobacterium kingsejongi]
MFQNYITAVLHSGKNRMARTIVSCCAVLSPLMLQAQEWEAVGDPNGISPTWGSFQNLAKDTNGNYYISYYDGSVAKGTVQKFNGTAWSYPGGTAGITTGTATYNSLVIDTEGNIIYTNQVGWPDSGMEVRKFDGTAWSALPKVTTGSVNFQASAVAADGTLLAANGEAQGTVKKLVNGVWQQVGTTGFAQGVPTYLDMVAGSNGKVYVSFVNGGNLYVYENNTVASTTQPWTAVGGNGFVAYATSSEQYRASMAIDAQDNLYVAYTSPSSAGNKINVKKYNGTAWSQVGAENFSEYRVHYVSIAVSAAGSPYVAFSNFENSPNNKNSVMAFDGTQWHALGSVVATGEAKWNSLIVDNEANLVLAYADESVDRTMVKKFTIGTTTPVAPQPEAGYCPVAFVNGCSLLSINSVVTTGGTTNLSNTNSGCSTNGYGDYTAQTLTASKNSTVSFTVGCSANTAYLKTWIDWNQDEVFEDSEQVYASATAEGTTVTFTVPVPETALTGTTRIRIKAVEGWDGWTACSTNSIGEAEDYTIDVTPTLGTGMYETILFSLFPNPVKQQLTITSVQEIQSVTFYSLLGQQVLKGTGGQHNIGSLERGIYLIQVDFTDGTSRIQKIIKE